MQRTRQRLETGLDLVMVVVAAYLQVEVEAGRIADRTEEMRHQFGRQIADWLDANCYTTESEES